MTHNGSSTVLFVAGETERADAAAAALDASGFEAVVGRSLDDARSALAERAVDCVVSGHASPSHDGLPVLDAVRGVDPTLPVVLYPASGSESLAGEAVRRDVSDYVTGDGADGNHAELVRRVGKVVGSDAPDTVRGAELRELRQFKEAVFESDLWVNVLDPEGNVVEMNETAADILGYPTDEIVGNDAVWEWLYPDEDYRAEMRAVTEEVLNGERRLEGFETTIRTRSGERRVISWFSYGLTDDDGEISGSIAIGRDVTERRERERALERELERREAAETRYRSLFENNPCAIWEEDLSAAKPRGDSLAESVDDVAAYLRDNPDELERLMSHVEIRDVNENAVDYYGADSKAELMANLDAVMPEESNAALAGVWASVAAGDTRYRAETVSRTLDGERRDEILDVYVPEAYADDYSRVYVVGTDITERRERERQLEELTARLELALAETDTGVWEWFVESDELRLDETCERLLGVGDDVPTTFEAFLDRVHDDDVAAVRDCLGDDPEPGEEYRTDFRADSACGDRRWIRARGVVKEGDPLRMLGIQTDITQQKRHERRLKGQRDDLDLLNQMLRHDIRNDLHVVSAAATLLAELVDGDEAREYVETILETVDSAVELTETAGEIADVTLTADDEHVRVDLRETLLGELDEVRAAYPDAVVSVEGDLPETTVLATDMLGSVFRNLLTNAIKHNDRSVPEVTVSAVERDGTVTARVADNGPGVPDPRKEALFARGETGTGGGGSGIGLYLVRTLVDTYGGDVWMEDNDPEGTVVVVSLPSADG
jgi:PAS domain S-box-containing protein